MRPVSSRTPYCVARNSVPEKFTGAPWVRWPPCGSASPSTVSPGFATARYAAMFACAPECGWTFACSALNKALARSMASCSTSSTTSQPPRSEEHTSELQSRTLISYAVFCLKKKNKQNNGYHDKLYKRLIEDRRQGSER